MKAGPGLRWFGRLSLLTILAALLLTTAALASAWAQFGGFGGLRPPPSTGIAGWILARQAFFYRALAAMLHAAKTTGSAYWGLMGISFIYGIFHAAGPGHGKAVISSYLVANEETWRRGITLSFASALLQSFSAIGIVVVAAVLIGATAKIMGDAVRGIETVCYAFIIVVGARLLWVKGKSFLAILRKVRPAGEPTKEAAGVAAHGHQFHSHDCGKGPCADHDPSHREHSHEYADRKPAHDHGQQHAHNHDDDDEESVLPWGHAHGPEPEELAGPGGWRRGLSAIVAVGLRPCSGAIIVLVFALAQGLFWAGVASTFVMGLGTAITVSSIATLAVGAKSVAKRFAIARPGYGVLALRGLEVGAACFVILFGVALLTGYMASERMGLF
jgi:nickel/cobalt transporter (NicO) family protein